MAIHLDSVPVLLDSEPVRAMRRDPVVWEVAAWQPPFYSYIDGMGEPLSEISQAITAGRPPGLDTLEGPWNSGARDYDQAEYALDPVGYLRLSDYSERERSLPYRIVRGDQFFADYAIATQGIPWRCSHRAFLIQAAETIDALDTAALRRDFSIKEMAAHGVYMTWPDDDEERTFTRAMNNLRQLARYYRDIAAHGYDLIMIQD